jgi:hypothetical protein
LGGLVNSHAVKVKAGSSSGESCSAS